MNRAFSQANSTCRQNSGRSPASQRTVDLFKAPGRQPCPLGPAFRGKTTVFIKHSWSYRTVTAPSAGAQMCTWLCIQLLLRGKPEISPRGNGTCGLQRPASRHPYSLHRVSLRLLRVPALPRPNSTFPLNHPRTPGGTNAQQVQPETRVCKCTASPPPGAGVVLDVPHPQHQQVLIIT